jgi:hypothetical protein
MAKNTDICEICGNSLTYLPPSEGTRTLRCHFCQREFPTNTFCEKGHFICDECHSKDAKEITIEFCEKTNLTNPFEIADEIMKHPKFKMYGPEHHFLVPAAILTALKNLGVKKPNGEVVSFKDVLEGIRRGATIPGGHCGFFGACGAGIGTGVVISIFTGGNPSRGRERTLAIQMTARVLTKVADGIEHCCKRSLKYAICEALTFLTENFEIEPKLDFIPAKCIFSPKNTKCELAKCPFH